jgi:hypothetical protein
VLAGNNSVVNWVILASAVVPVLIVAVGSYFFLRAGRKHDERERSVGPSR